MSISALQDAAISHLCLHVGHGIGRDMVPKRLAGVAPEVNMREHNTRGTKHRREKKIYPDQTWQTHNRCHQKSEIRSVEEKNNIGFGLRQSEHILTQGA